MRRILILLVLGLLAGWMVVGLVDGAPLHHDEQAGRSLRPAPFRVDMQPASQEPLPLVEAAPAATPDVAISASQARIAARKARREARRKAQAEAQAIEESKEKKASDASDALRRRVAEGAVFGTLAAAGNATAAAVVAQRLADESDPRVRAALREGTEPELGENRPRPVILPPAVRAADPQEAELVWASQGDRNRTTVQIRPDGRATVDTVMDGGSNDRWHVRYDAWAWRGADGELVIDARNQPVTYLERPSWGSWSPDSLVISTDGAVRTEDDAHRTGNGQIPDIGS